MNYIYIILGVSLVVLLIVLYYTFFKDPATITSDKKYLMQSVPSMPFTNLANPSSRRYSYSMWIYINNPPASNTVYNFFQQKSSDDATKFNLTIDGKGKLSYALNASNATDSTTVVTNFPFQKWVNLVVSVDANIVDFYVDGKLVLSDKNDKAQESVTDTTSKISFGDATKPQDMYLSLVGRFPTAMDPQTVWNNYKAGQRSLTGVGSDGMRVVFTKDMQEINNLTLF